eukprot:13062257-Heterocapsa_arctica.AAC.1
MHTDSGSPQDWGRGRGRGSRMARGGAHTRACRCPRAAALGLVASEREQEEDERYLTEERVRPEAGAWA